MADAPTQDAEQMSEEERRMMAEWEAMAGGGDGGGGAAAAADSAFGGEAVPAPDLMPMEEGGNTRILNQAEIDSLLGFDDAGGESETSGVMALINSALVNYERLPMLDIVFDRLVRLMSTSLRNLTSDNVEVSLDQISTVRFGDYLNSIPLPAMLSVFKAEEWDNNGLIVVDSSLIYSVVDVLLGGRKGTPSIRVEGRPYTTIETRLVERMLNVTLNDMSSAFDPLSPVSFKLENMETNPRFAAITQSGNACVLVRMRIDMGDRGGRVEILIPYATLEPVRELLLQMFMGEKFGRDSIWETHLTNELYQTDVHLQAVMGEKTVMLRDMLNWTKGTLVMFNTKPSDQVEMRCGDFPMYLGPLGQKEGNIAVRIERYIPPEQE
ncbi:MAG: flagellar motor switch protein FliM [Alphaproteobacteria bacterium]|jgi:flagellar motor switch protein FliM|nr:flagellar motor switch protein FliM [Alphaproteobacteria bacterium]MBP9868006.1 flagellar motor switch protein FliM [Alphaproteobacteria bacterium]